MEIEKLQIHISILATLPETNAPVISCYLTLEKGRLKDPNAFDERIRSLGKSLSEHTQRDVDEALNQIARYLAAELLPDAKGAAIFSSREQSLIPSTAVSCSATQLDCDGYNPQHLPPGGTQRQLPPLHCNDLH